MNQVAGSGKGEVGCTEAKRTPGKPGVQKVRLERKVGDSAYRPEKLCHVLTLLEIPCGSSRDFKKEVIKSGD